MHLRRFLLYVVFLLASIMAVDVHATDGSSWWNTDYNTTEGTDFWVTFMRNAGKGKFDTDLYLRLFASARQEADVTVYFNGDTTSTEWGPNSQISFHVNAGSMNGLQNDSAIPNYLAYLEDITDKYKGIYVHSTTPITLYALNYFQDSYDATIIFPLTALSKSYVIQTYKQDHSATEFVLIGTENNTSVTINPIESNVPKTPINLIIGKGETYIYRSSNNTIDLSGTYICASEPIGVFHGNQDAFVPTGTSNGPANHLYEQALPTDKWGKKFIVSRSANQERDVVRVTAAENNTKIYINGTLTSTINQFQTFEKSIKWSDYPENALCIEASRAVECGLYLTSFNANRSTSIGAPTLTSITPLEYGVHSTITASFPFRPEMQQYHYINIVTPTASLNNLRLDGQAINASYINNLSYNVNGKYYSAIRVPVDTTAHLITNTSDVFVSHSYGIGHYEDEDGNSSDESYAYSAGSNILHPAWMLINGEQTDSVAVCEDEMPVTFTSVINYDYTNVRWEHHYLLGRDSNIISPSSVNSDGLQATGDSVYSRYYEDIPRGLPLVDHIDTVYMIVTRKTPICDNIIIDTIKAIVQVNDTFRIDENAEYNLNGNVCYGDSFTVHHQNQDYHYIADTTSTQYYDGKLIKFKLNEPYSFFDSLKTQYGCDSVINQIRILRPTYETSVTDTICVNHLPYSNTLSDANGTEHTITIDLTRNQKNSITGKSTRRLNPIIKDTTVLLKTIYDCDSIVHLTLVVLPIYEIQSPAVTTCMDSTQYYEWAGHTSKTGIFSGHKIYLDGQRITTGISLQTPGTFTYVDSLKTKGCKQCNDRPGCDSVYKITITVLEQVVIRNSQTLCANESFEWNDSLYIGPSFDINDLPSKYRTNRKYRRIGNTTLVREFTTADDFHCAALDMLYVTWCPTYNTTETVHICETEVYYFRPSSKDHSHDKTFNQNHEWACQTDAHGAKIVGQYTLKATVETNIICPNNHGCDSIVTHIVYVHPTYDFVKVDSVCQGYPYVWNDHTNRDLYDSIQQKKIHFAESIPANEPGWHTYVDQLKTVTCGDCATGGCDSIWTLRLYVIPSVYYDTAISLCPEQLPYEYCRENGATLPIGTTGIVDKTETIPSKRYTSYLCDSVITYHFSISNENIIPILVTRCNNEQPYSYNYGVEPAGVHHTGRLENISISGVYRDTVTIENQCRTIYELTLTVRDTTTRTITYYHCDGETYEDVDYPSIKTQKDTSYVKRLVGANAVGCDSVVYVTVRFGRTYQVNDPDVVLCERDSSYTWRTSDTHGSYSHILRWHGLHEQLLDTTLYDTLHTISPYHCDSLTQVHIVVKPTVYYEHSETICPTQVPYRDFGNHDEDALVDGTYTHYINGGSVRYGCDSIEILHLTIRDSIVTHLYDTTCNNALPYNHVSPHSTPNLEGLTTSGTYRQILTAVTGCDSAIVLHLTVQDTTTRTITYYHCDGETYEDVNYPSIKTQKDTSYVKRLVGANAVGCDSVVYVTVRFGRTYQVNDPDTILCERANQFVWYTHDSHSSNPYVTTLIWGDLHERRLDTVLEKTLKTIDPYSCDSITRIRVIVNPTLYTVVDTTLCPEQLPFQYCENGKMVTAEDIYPLTRIDTLESRQYGCDSIITYHIDVNDVDIHRVYDSICFNHLPYSYAYPSSGIEYQPLEKQRLLNLCHDTVAYDTMRHEGLCLHIVELHLKVNAVYDTTLQLVTICQGQTTYEWRREGLNDAHRGELIKELPLPISGGNPEEDFIYYHVYDTTITTNQTGCDSTLHMPLIIYRTYFSADTVSISDKESFTWVKNRQDTTVYGVSCPDKPDDVEGLEAHKEYYLYKDSLYSIYGCDSVHYQYIYVRPTFTVWDSAYVCQDRNNVYQWAEHENSTRIFNEYGVNVTSIPLDPAGEYLYYDSLKTVAGDDSIFGLYLMIYPIYYLPVVCTDIHICDNQQYHFHTAYFDTVYNTDGNLNHGDELLYYFDIEKTDTTMHGCDSAVWHRVFVHPTYYREKEDSVCQTSPYIWEGHDSMSGHSNAWIWDVQQQKRIGRDAIPTNVRVGVYTYIDSLLTKTCTECPGNGCDSIWVLRLRVDSIYAHYDTITMSDEESQKWQHTVYIGPKVLADTLSSMWFVGETQQQVVRILDGSIVNDFDTTYLTIHNCDSIFYLHLLVGPTYRDTIEGWTCDNEPYHWYHAGDSVHEARPDITILKPGYYYDSLKTKQFGFDSIYVLILYNYPTYHYSEDDTVCQYVPYHWPGHVESERFYLLEESRWVDRDNISTSMWGHYTYVDSLKTHEPESHTNQNRHNGCDSIWTLHLFIPQTYHFYDTLPLCENDTLHWQGMLFGGSQYEAYSKEYGDTTIFDSIVLNLNHGTYYRDIRRSTIFECDSTYHLTLKVYEVAHTDSVDSVCQGHPFFNPNWNWGEGMYMNTDRVGTYVSVDTIHSRVSSCDSIVTLTLRVDSVYDYRPYFEFCQDTIHTDTIVEWNDEAGELHTFRLDISGADTFSYTDSLTSIHGCDSIFGVTWLVHPIYRFDSTYVICQDERVDWQGRGYSGSEYGWGYVRLPGDRPDENKDSIYYHYVPTDSILAAGVYYDTARYTTVEGCDSTYYLTLIVNPAGHEIRNAHVCDKDAFYVFHTDDTYGHHTDTIFFPLISRMLSATMKDTLYYEKERRLRTSRDCDSTVHMHLTVHPTYQFVTRAKICWNQQYEWRDHVCEDTTGAFPTRKYNKTGIYYDSCATKRWNCDSVYVLELFVKPVTIINRFIHVCENETYWHIDTAWNRLDSTVYSVDSTIVWTPGMQILDTNEYRDVTFISPDGCDSLIYRYHVTLEKTYLFDTLVTMCSSESFPLHAGHIFVPITDYYDTHSSVASYDTTYSDTLRSIWGCDSIYRIRAHIHPSYRYIAYDTICERDPFIWRDEQRIYNGHGDFVFYDRYQTALYHCDSIYEMRLHVHESPIENTTEYICEEDLPYHYTFSDKYTDIYVSGYYTDTLPNRFGCDSILNLTLVVLDTLVTIEYDTICHSDTLLRGHFAGWNLTKAGAYYDTTAIDTILFCKHYWTLYLHVIEPTYYDLFVPEICADEDSLIIGYSYYGRPIESYTVYFEYSEADPHFETVYTGELDPDDRTFGIPMPFGDALPHPNPTYFDTKQGIQQYTYEDRYQYIRPDTYKMTVILHNGICSDRLQRKDTTLNIIYPSWIHEQHWNDGIVLFNEKYNGGYTFTHYQWYYNDEPIIGQTREFLYWPDSTRLMNEPGQSEDDYCEKEYKVLLTRSDDGKSIFTCPICPIHIFDSIVPREDYFAIVPTLVVVENPVVWILATQPGTYSYCIFTGEGRSRGCGSLALSKGTYTPDQNNYAGTLTLPVVYDGYLFIELCPPNGECRTFKIKMIQGH